MTKPRACRACLSVDVKLHNITETLMANAFETATGLSMSDNMHFPPYLCTFCCKSTQNCIRFRRQCLTAQQTLVALCTSSGMLTQELLKSSDIKNISWRLTKSVTEYVDYTPLKSRETSPAMFGDGVEIKVEYPLSNNPLSDVDVKHDPIEDEISPEAREAPVYTVKKEYNFLDTTRPRKPKPDATQPQKQNQKPVAKLRKVSITNCATDITDRPKEKTYQCDTCGKTFINTRNLMRHRKIHSSERPFKCDACDKSFIVRSSLTIHKRVHTGEKPYKCEVCGVAFKQRTHYIAHKRIHTGEKPYTCLTCNKSFNYSTHLVTHKRTHTGEKPYTCDTCGRSFKTLSSLIPHKRTHTGEKPYRCEACGKCFNKSSGVCRHKRKHCAVRVN